MTWFGFRKHLVGKGSWKNEQFETFNLESLTLESFYLSWKIPIEVGKFSMQFQVIKNFPTSTRTFQFHFFQLAFATTCIPSFLIRFQTVNSLLVFSFKSWFCQFPESRISLEFSSWSSIKNNGEVRDNPAGSVDATANTSNITRIIWKRSCKYYIVFKNIIGRGDSMILTFDVPPLTDNSNCLIWLKDRARTSLFYEIFLKTLCYTV